MNIPNLAEAFAELRIDVEAPPFEWNHVSFQCWSCKENTMREQRLREFTREELGKLGTQYLVFEECAALLIPAHVCVDDLGPTESYPHDSTSPIPFGGHAFHEIRPLWNARLIGPQINLQRFHSGWQRHLKKLTEFEPRPIVARTLWRTPFVSTQAMLEEIERREAAGDDIAPRLRAKVER